MLPVLIAVGPFKIYSYALFLLLALVLFWFMVWKKGRELHFDESDLFDATAVILFWAIVGSRLSYIFLVKFTGFGWNILNWVNVMGKPGLWLVGFFVCGGVAASLQAKRRKWDFYNLTDVLLMALILYQAVMNWGEFLNGSKYGIIANNFLGLRFGGMMDKHIPVQLYEGILLGLVFWLLIWVEGQYRTYSWYKGSKSEASSGFITAVYFMALGVIGLVLFFLKMPNMVWWGVRLDVLWELLYLIFGSLLLYKRSGVKWSKNYSGWSVRKAEKKANTSGINKGQTQSVTDKKTSRWSSDIFN